MATALSTEWSARGVALDDVLAKLASLRERSEEDGAPELRTSVMTHLAWVPPPWLEKARAALAGLAERHPSRTILLVPEPDAEDGIDAAVALHAFAIADSERRVSTEVVELTLRGCTASAPASVAWPLLISDLPVFCRWRGEPDWRGPAVEQLTAIADRTIVDSTEWPRLPEAYADLAAIFERTAVSDIAWARTSRWRRQLATLWPRIAEVRTISVRGTEAQAYLLAGWLTSRLGHEVDVEHEPAERLEAVEVDGEHAPFPPGDAPAPSELLSDELDRFGRDRVYEDAVRAASSRSR